MIVSISAMDDFGRGISYDLDKICFIPNCMIGEKVFIEIVKSKKKFYEGRVVYFVEKSLLRKKDLCPYGLLCGGCQISFFNNKMENDFKKNKFKNIMHKFAKIDVEDVEIVSSTFSGYRNKITLVVNDGVLGLISEGSLDIVPIDKCLIANDKINSVISELSLILKSELNVNKVVIKVGNKTNEVLLSIVGNILSNDKFLDICDVLFINNKCVSSRKYIMSYILDCKFLISNYSFFQINYDITNKLYSYILDMVRNCGSKQVLDLYCGVGSIGITISKYVESVYGIEIVEEAIYNANINKKLNKISNISFQAGDVSNFINSLPFEFDTYILDPPRSGVDRVVINNILSMKPNNIIYVSCNPITLARDISLLRTDYEVVNFKLFNMFPRTYHVECVCVMRKINNYK